MTERLTSEQLLERYPCWCGRPAVEVVSEFPDVDALHGYCATHAERSLKVVVRERQRKSLEA